MSKEWIVSAPSYDDLSANGGHVLEDAKRAGEYAKRGDYHKELDPTWSYYPIYIRKMEWIETYVREHVSKECYLLDAGCGEGVFVEKLSSLGYRVVGIDKHYSSDLVQQGDLLDIPFAPETFEVVFCLDVIEHLDLLIQEKALDEISRVLKPGGRAIISLPNLAHLASRWEFFRRGNFIRTANIRKHPGDRPIGEYLTMVDHARLRLVERIGIKMALPENVRSWLGHRLSERIMYWSGAPASLCFLNILICQKGDG